MSLLSSEMKGIIRYCLVQLSFGGEIQISMQWQPLEIQRIDTSVLQQKNWYFKDFKMWNTWEEQFSYGPQNKVSK